MAPAPGSRAITLLHALQHGCRPKSNPRIYDRARAGGARTPGSRQGAAARPASWAAGSAPARRRALALAATAGASASSSAPCVNSTGVPAPCGAGAATPAATPAAPAAARPAAAAPCAARMAGLPDALRASGEAAAGARAPRSRPPAGCARVCGRVSSSSAADTAMQPPRRPAPLRVRACYQGWWCAHMCSSCKARCMCSDAASEAPCAATRGKEHGSTCAVRRRIWAPARQQSM